MTCPEPRDVNETNRPDGDPGCPFGTGAAEPERVGGSESSPDAVDGCGAESGGSAAEAGVGSGESADPVHEAEPVSGAAPTTAEDEALGEVEGSGDEEVRADPLDSAPAPRVARATTARPAGRRVLLADNDPNVAAILELFLRKSGAEVVSVPHGQAALDALAAEPFRLLVCDLDMPVMSGEELLERIGADPSTPPVFVISGYVDEVTSARLRSYRAVIDVLRKPFDLRAFAARVGDLLDGCDKSSADPGLGLFGEA